MDLIPQRELAAEIGVDASYISAIRNGRREPSPRMLVGMRGVLNQMLPDGEPPITMDELMEWVEAKRETREAALGEFPRRARNPR